MGSGHGWLAGDWTSTGGVLNITAAAWTAGFHWWRSVNISRTQNVSEYVLVLALCLVGILLAEIELIEWSCDITGSDVKCIGALNKPVRRPA